jgi:hypothetical protein
MHSRKQKIAAPDCDRLARARAWLVQLYRSLGQARQRRRISHGAKTIHTKSNKRK